MRRPGTTPRAIGLAGMFLALALASSPMRAQTAAAPENLVESLSGLETPADIDVPALRARALERIKARGDIAPLKRPPIAPELLSLPQATFEIQFDPDSSIVRPGSYQTLGRIADALTQPGLLSTTFLVVCHTESNGKREPNLIVSQRRADSIRDVLTTMFRISPKRIRTLGLGEEQLQDANRPNAATNLRLQIITVGKAAER
jgi:OmpA-OmpF porin, OOP family